MSKINLLPSDLTPNKSILKFSDILIKVSYVFVALLLTFILALIAIFIIDSTQIKKLKSQEAELTKSISEYKQTEQQIVLAKDRIAIIEEIWKTNKAYDQIDAFKKVLTLTDNNISVTSFGLTSSKSEITLEALSANSVANFMGQIVTSNIYKSILLTNFSLNPSSGYKITLETVLK